MNCHFISCQSVQHQSLCRSFLSACWSLSCPRQGFTAQQCPKTCCEQPWLLQEAFPAPGGSQSSAVSQTLPDSVPLLALLPPLAVFHWHFPAHCSAGCFLCLFFGGAAWNSNGNGVEGAAVTGSVFVLVGLFNPITKNTNSNSLGWTVHCTE